MRPWASISSSPLPATRPISAIDRKSVVLGKRVSVRVETGGRRIIKHKKHIKYHNHTTNTNLCIVVSDNYIMFIFKQKTAYEMRSSDWSSDLCSSDLLRSCP